MTFSPKEAKEKIEWAKDIIEKIERSPNHDWIICTDRLHAAEILRHHVYSLREVGKGDQIGH